jgi:hypothetical protein
MSLLPEDASFEELVQECFVAYRGGGLMLSALDAQLLVSWSRANVPFEVVARGIRRAAERASYDARPGEPPLRTLRACRREVEEEIERHRARDLGRGQALRAEGLEGGWAALARKRPELAEVIARIAAGEHPGDADRRSAALLRALPFAERIAILRRARALEPLTPLSPRGRRMTRRFHRALALGEALGVRGLG